MVAAKGADFVTRHFDSRQFNVITRQRINKRGEIIVLKKPRIPHTGWLDQKTYDEIPKTLTVRKSQIKIIRAGYRDEWLTIITTLTDAKLYTQENLADIYLWRWQVELDLRVIKRLMGLNFVAAKTPEMVAKEVWIRLLAYNIIRSIIAMAAHQSSKLPRQISFKGCLGLIIAYHTAWKEEDFDHRCIMFEDMLSAIAGIKAAHRPNRQEPRAIKRRPGCNLPLLKKPRKSMGDIQGP